MTKRSNPIFFAMLVLAIVTLSCSMGTKTELVPATAVQSAPVLGEVHRCEDGGFALQTIIDYSLDDSFGIVEMTRPGVDASTGPGVTAMGGPMDADFSSQELYDLIVAEDKTFTYSSTQAFSVGGVEGLLADLSGDQDGQKVKGQLFVSRIKPYQQFVMLGLAPDSEWKTLQPVFHAVLDSVTFFESTAAVLEAPEEPVSQPVQPLVSAPVAIAVEPEAIRQWAVRATASSERSKTDGAAMRATGEADVFQCGKSANAWSPYSPKTEEHLILEYEIPVLPTEIVIYQSLNPSQVVEIQLVDLEGEAWLLWYGDPEEVSDCPDRWTHTIELDEPLYINSIVIFVDQSIKGWGKVEIDAVELVGYAQDAPVGQTASLPASEPAADPAAAPAAGGGVPANYTGWMAEPVYQGWINIKIDETRVENLDQIMTIPGRRETSSFKPRDNHADTFIYDMGRDKLLGYISVTTDGVVYKKAVAANANLSEHGLASVTRENYEALKAIYDRDKVIPYTVMAEMLESPGFLREEYIRQDDGKIINTYNWYNARGDKIVGIFYDGLLTGMIGLNFIEKP